MILLLENIIRGVISSVMGDRYVQSDENKKILYRDITILFGHWMSKPLPFVEIKFEKENVCLREIINTTDDNEIGYFSHVDLSCPYTIRQKTKNFPFSSENKSISKDDFNEYMKNIKPKNTVSHNKLICDWTDKKKYLIHYRMLKFFG